jgi:hypothetical protein
VKFVTHATKVLMAIIFTRATSQHIEGFLRLQQLNLISNIDEHLHSGGFVTTPFTTQQLHTLMSDEHLFIALDGETVIGYMVCASWQFLQQYPIFAHMITLIPELKWEEHHVTTHNSYQYGPICIDAAYRGQGILEQFFCYARQEMYHHYDYALTFINKRNTRSAKAHIQKLQLDVISEFEFKGQEFHLLAFCTAHRD